MLPAASHLASGTRRIMTKRLTFGVWLAASMLLTACNGWPKAQKLAEVRHKPEKYPTYAATPAQQVQTFAFENRHWLVSPSTVDLHAAKLQSVGNAGGVSLYAEEGAQSPYQKLYAPAGETKWHAVVPIN
jgi:hypothetical protein